MNQSIVIVDGNSLINRAYFAMSELKNSKGVYTGGVHGLTAMIFNLIENFNPTHFCVAFDMKGPTFRHLTYDAYKGTRKGMPNELAMQMPIVKEILDALNIAHVELQGYEADDLIGTIAKQCVDRGMAVNVITGDKDALQLVAFGAKVHITKKGISQLKLYEDIDVMEDLGVHANQVIDYKGLSGDASDNIPGVPSIGPKTASKLLEAFGTVENLLENVSLVENKRIQGLLVEHAEQALLSKRLATIFTEVPIEIDFNQLIVRDPNLDEAVKAFKFYELTSLLNKLKINVKSEEQQVDHEWLDMDCQSLSDALKQTLSFTFKLYYDVSNIVSHKLIAAGFYYDEKAVITHDVDHILLLKDVFENEKISKSGYNIKDDYLFLMGNGIDLNGVTFDGFIAAYLIDPARRNYDLAEVVFEHNSNKIVSTEDILGKGVKKLTYAEVDVDKLDKCIVSQLNGIVAIKKSFEPILKAQNLTKLFSEVEIPLIKILADIEYTGFKVDLVQIDQIDVQLVEKIKDIETTIFEMANETFNINSPKQLGVILFEKLSLPSGKKTKTGYSTGIDVLEKLIDKHPIVREIIEYRMYTKLKSTYIDGLRLVIDPSEPRVHTSLNQTIAVTGRLSSTEPNLQNIPIKLPYGRKIRKFFVADPGCVLLDADYSQIELRVLAHLSKDPKLIDAFSNNVDIHTLTASQVFKIPVTEVTSLQRSRAKEVNFGIVYGMGDFGLSESIGVSRKEAKLYIENYFISYPRVQGFMEEIIEACKENGYVETILNRKRTIADINASNFMLRSAAERTARNTPIQGSAADIIKLAMIKVYETLKQNGLKSKLILQVHDELILNVPLDELDVVKPILKYCMEECYALSVPLKVDMNTGDSWYEAK
jgi:DNA polymerase-1